MPPDNDARTVAMLHLALGHAEGRLSPEQYHAACGHLDAGGGDGGADRLAFDGTGEGAQPRPPSQADILMKLLSDPLVGDDLPYLEYSATHDDRTRPEHLAMERMGLDGTAVYRRDDPVWKTHLPPWDYNCFLPGTAIQGSFFVGLKSFYAGQAIELRTREGHTLAVTANHPVLTTRGLVPAHRLRKGDSVISYRGGDERFLRPDRREERPVDLVAGANQSGVTSPRQGEQNAPSHADEVFESLRLMGGLSRVPVARHEFHGDAARGDGHVEVVASDRELRLYVEANRTHGGGDFRLARVDKPSSLMSRLGTGHHRGFGNDAPTGGIPSPAALPLDGGPVEFQSGPFQLLRVGSASRINASLSQASREGVAGESQFAAELQQRFAGLITADEIVHISKFDFRGHVYDFQTPGGWIIADGVMCSNCRCVVIPLSVEDAAAKGVREAQEWLSSGRPPATPQHVRPVPFSPPEGWHGPGGDAAP